MKRDYSKWCSVALITAIYALAGVAGWLLFSWLTKQAMQPVLALSSAWHRLLSNSSPTSRAMISVPLIPVKYAMWACGNMVVIRITSAKYNFGGAYGLCMLR